MASNISKASIRQQVWSYLEDNDIALFPRPAFHRIPNFKGSDNACNKIKDLPEFESAQTIEINPDTPQKQARFLTLEVGKTLLVPTPRLKSGLFNKILPPAGANKKILHVCSSSEGVKNYSCPISLTSKIKVDLVIIGSVAVSPSGHRIGKGEGYADMEFAMMATMKAVDPETTVVTTVHDCQVLDSMPEDLFQEHDVPVDIILTPTRVIRCMPRLPKPSCIIWSLLTEERMNEIPILRKLKQIEDTL